MVRVSQPELGILYKKRRLELGLTQSQLAERIGTSQSHIAKIESGEYDPRGAVRQRINEALDLQFVVKDASYEITERLEMMYESISGKIDLILKKMKIRQ